MRTRSCLPLLVTSLVAALLFTQPGPLTGQTVINAIPVGTPVGSVGNLPFAIAVSETTNHVYVTLQLKNEVQVIDTTTNSVVATIPTGLAPYDLAINPNTNRLYSADEGDFLSVINAATNTLIGTFPAGNGPSGVRVNPITNRVYVTVFWDRYLAIYDGATNAVVRTIPIRYPAGLEINPVTNRLYVTSRSDASILSTTTSSVVVIDLNTESVIANIQVANQPFDVGVNHITNRIYTANYNGNSVSVINGATNTKMVDIPVAGSPRGIGVDTANNRVYVARADAHEIAVIDGATNTLLPPIPVGGASSQIKVHPTTGLVYAGVSRPTGDVVVVLGTATPNQPPVAVAGAAQTVRLGTTVYLDGSNSFDDNTSSAALSYSWQFATLPAGSSAVLTGSNTATPSFVPDLMGNYAMQLVVTDQGGLSSAPSLVLVSPNAPPMANAGFDQTALVNSVVQLPGAVLDPEGETLVVQWSFIAKPSSSSAVLLDPASASTSFVPDVAGTYSLRLAASDPLGPGIPDDVTIVVTTAATYAASLTLTAAGVVATLPPAEVTNAGNQNALSQLMANAIASLDSGNVAQAAQKLEQAISRTDGCDMHGAPDGNGAGRDWVTTCSAQAQIYPLLTAALNAIQP